MERPKNDAIVEAENSCSKPIIFGISSVNFGGVGNNNFIKTPYRQCYLRSGPLPAISRFISPFTPLKIKIMLNLKITQMKRKLIFLTSIFGFKMLIFQVFLGGRITPVTLPSMVLGLQERLPEMPKRPCASLNAVLTSLRRLNFWRKNLLWKPGFLSFLGIIAHIFGAYSLHKSIGFEGHSR